MLLLGAVLGSSRPKGNDSHWPFYHDANGVSGHTFMGAVPFLTAAAMTENQFLKVPLFLGSFLTGWARINDDRHFFSQVALGWWMAYLAVRTVDDTQADLRSYSITPTFSPDGAGVALQIRY
jgi:membrane-associated phospholipid phosphatase